MCLGSEGSEEFPVTENLQNTIFVVCSTLPQYWVTLFFFFMWLDFSLVCPYPQAIELCEKTDERYKRAHYYVSGLLSGALLRTWD